MRNNKMLAERIWTLFNSWHLTPSQIDHELCLDAGTAKRVLRMRWEVAA